MALTRWGESGFDIPRSSSSCAVVVVAVTCSGRIIFCTVVADVPAVKATAMFLRT